MPILKFTDGRRVSCEIVQAERLVHCKWADSIGIWWVGKLPRVTVKFIDAKGNIRINKINPKRLLKNDAGELVEREGV